MKETTLLFGRRRSLVGVLSQSEEVQTGRLAVILLNAGLIHHAGPNRLYVRLARHLTKMGLLVFRFDLSGVGDSRARTDNLPFEQGVIDDARQAMEELERLHGIQRFIFIGHCSGAAQSFLMAIEDERVVGAVLLNPQPEREDWHDYDRKLKVQHYYQKYYGKQVLTDAKRWRKFLTGQADYRSVFNNIFRNILWSRVTTTAFKFRTKVQTRAAKPDPGQERVVEGMKYLRSRQTPMLLVYSAGSSGLERLQVMLGKDFDTFVDGNQIRYTLIEGADHTFTLRGSQDIVIKLVADWCAPLVETFAISEPEIMEEGVL